MRGEDFYYNHIMGFIGNFIIQYTIVPGYFSGKKEKLYFYRFVINKTDVQTIYTLLYTLNLLSYPSNNDCILHYIIISKVGKYLNHSYFHFVNGSGFLEAVLHRELQII